MMRKLSQQAAPLLLAAGLGLQPPLRADSLTSLGKRPEWSSLDKYQQTITREEFLERLDTLYAPGDAWRDTVEVRDDYALIKTREGAEPYRLVFADESSIPNFAPRYWRKPPEVLANSNEMLPLTGYYIALDPGHIGGAYGPMEGRSWRIGDGPPIQEGDIVLEIARLLKTRLEELGAKVTLIRDNSEPLTTETPASLRDEAEAWLRQKQKAEPESEPPTEQAIRKRAELLFYRVAEIRARAGLVNNVIQPDLVLCLHLNAEDFADYANPEPVEPNHLHLLVNGAYSAGELAYDDIRYEMLIKLLNDSSLVEREAAASLAATMAEATGLEPFSYGGSNAVAIPGQPYVWGRNLLANRLYTCPVVFLEPYVANSSEVYPRLVEALSRKPGEESDLYDEYIDGITGGLVDYFKRNRKLERE